MACFLCHVINCSNTSERHKPLLGKSFPPSAVFRPQHDGSCSWQCRGVESLSCSRRPNEAFGLPQPRLPIVTCFTAYSNYRAHVSWLSFTGNVKLDLYFTKCLWKCEASSRQDRGTILSHYVRASTLAVKLLLEQLALKTVTEGKTERAEDLCES